MLPAVIAGVRPARARRSRRRGTEPHRWRRWPARRCFAGLLFVLHLASPAGLGFGDVKLGLLLGLYLGAVSLGLVLWGLLLGSLVGVVAALPVAVRTRDRRAGIPFGPALAAGTVLALILAGPLGRLTSRGSCERPATISTLAPDAPLPDRRRVARQGPRRHRRGPARRPAHHGRGGPGRAGPPPPRLRPRAAHALRAGRRHAARPASATAARWARPWPSRSATPSGCAATSGTRRCRPRPGATAAPLTQPRPGHADLAGMQKYGFTDARDVLERASARETAARVAAGHAGQEAAGQRSASRCSAT